MNQQMEDDLVEAPEAAALLGVKPATLYAYVSRGLVTSLPAARGRARRYRRRDLQALRDRRGARSESRPLSWGEPVLDSSITQMTAAGPVYRGHGAVPLAQEGVVFEAVAELLWTGRLPESAPRWTPPGPEVFDGLPGLTPSSASPAARLCVVTAILQARDPGRYDTAPAAVLPRARTLVRALAASLSNDPGQRLEALGADTVAESVALALGVRATRRTRLALDQVLVLLADHELNASTFAARVVASTAADPYAVVLGGLATLSGPRHGAASDQVEALAREADGREPRTVVHERARRGEAVPGFGHPFYPGASGDPRGRLLLESARALAPRNRTVRTMVGIAEAMASEGRPPPNVDAAIVAVRGALGLPVGSAAAIFAVARCAGWIAHALEQYQSGELLRPRARYLGPEVATSQPESSSRTT